MTEIQYLMQPEVRQFILTHEDAAEQDIVLRQKPVQGVSPAALATQIAGRRKAREKLPQFYAKAGILYPPSLNLEQCSSEATALIKHSLLTEILTFDGNVHGADLTGGFGVDSFYLSHGCGSFDYVEPNQSLSDIAQHNHRMLGADHIRHHAATAEEFLKRTDKKFSFLFLDPSRRKESQKVFRFADCAPNAAAMLPALLERAEWIMIKTSPLMDLQQGIRDLGFVAKIVIVSVRNECREVLFLCRRDFAGEPEIRCLNIKTSGELDRFSFLSSEEKTQTVAFSDPLTYVYEPNAAILKGGAFKLAGHRFGLKKIQQHTHLYTSDTLALNFPGRIFKVDFLNPAAQDLPAYLPGSQANILTRNYPLSPDELKKKLKLKDGGEKFLLGFSGVSAKFTVAATRVQ